MNSGVKHCVGPLKVHPIGILERTTRNTGNMYFQLTSDLIVLHPSLTILLDSKK